MSNETDHELTSFVATVRKPDILEAYRIARAQSQIPNRAIVCNFLPEHGENFPLSEEEALLFAKTSTRIPSRHRYYGMRRELEENLVDDMTQADFVQILDLSER